jgi:hypothetical protein
MFSGGGSYTNPFCHTVRQFHEAPQRGMGLSISGWMNLKVRRESGRKCVQMLVAYWVRADGTRQLLAFMRSQGESQLAWEGLLNDLYQRGIKGRRLQLIVISMVCFVNVQSVDRISYSIRIFTEAA